MATFTRFPPVKRLMARFAQGLEIVHRATVNIASIPNMVAPKVLVTPALNAHE